MVREKVRSILLALLIQKYKYWRRVACERVGLSRCFLFTYLPRALIEP